MAAPTPSRAQDSVVIPLSPGPGDSTFPNLVAVNVGDASSNAQVLFDTGSTGLFIKQEFIGAYTDLHQTFTQSYRDGTELSGELVATTVTFSDAQGTPTTSTVTVGMITNIGCKYSTCPAFTQAGILGARYYNYNSYSIFNPLAFLPGNLGSGYLVAADGPTPSIIAGITPSLIDGFPQSAQFTVPTSNPGNQDGATQLWEIKSINACFALNGGTPRCQPTSFDTGASEGLFYLPNTADQYVVPKGDTVTIDVQSGAVTYSVTYTAGDTPWSDRFSVLKKAEGKPEGDNSGAAFYYSYAIAYDAVNGYAYFSPLSTWITGSHTAHDDSELGRPGAIALYGDLGLDNGFSSSRAIFIGGPSTIDALGSVTLSGTLSGSAPLTLAGGGSLSLTGISTNTGPITAHGLTLYVDGSTPAPIALSDGTLGGNGAIGTLTAGTNATIAPGHSIGTMVVTGDAGFAAGSTYEAEIGAPGHSDLVAITGQATITGGALRAIPVAGETPGIGSYTVLTAVGGSPGHSRSRPPNSGR